MTAPGHGQEMFTEAFWDERYGSRPTLWSGNPNPHLVAEVGDIVPGTALDVGSGEGADCIWLARQGWTVVGVDVSGVALSRAAEHAAGAGADIAARIEWARVDLREWTPEPRRFDLISAQYLHFPADLRERVYRGLAAAVAPGGTLLVVAHHPLDLDTTMGRPPVAELFFTGADILALLDVEEWDVVTDSAPPRQATDPDGREVTIHDTVLRVRRRG